MTPTPIDPSTMLDDAHWRDEALIASFGDSLAERTAWSPAKSGGAIICTHRLTQRGPDRAAFRPTPTGRLIPLVPSVIGLSITVWLGYETFVREGGGGVYWIVFLAVFAVASVGGSLLMVRVLNRPVYFDRGAGACWRGRRRPAAGRGVQAALDRVRAVQIIAELVPAGSVPFWSYEINLVLDDASRMNVVDHAGRDAVREDAAALARWLGVPVWDASGRSDATGDGRYSP